MELTPSPATPPSEPEPDRSATRYRNSGRPLMVDGFTISLLLVLAAAYLPCLVRESQPTRADLRAVLRMAAVFLGARSHGQVEFFSVHAEARFTAYLLATKRAELLTCDCRTLQRWLQAHDVATVTAQLEMAACAARVLQVTASLDVRERQALVVIPVPETNTARRVPTQHEDTKTL